MREIILGNGMVTQVDDSDYEWLNKWNWTATHGGEFYYASRWNPRKKGQKGNGPIIWMAHEIFGKVPKGKHIDYMDRNPLNNQRSNLRLADKYEESWNKGKLKTKNGKPLTSIYKGVSIQKRKNSIRWVMQITAKGKRYSKVFLNEIEAAREFDRLAKKLQGEFAVLNFPTD